MITKHTSFQADTRVNHVVERSSGSFKIAEVLSITKYHKTNKYIPSSL